jgi:hypothetical protein
MVLTSITNLQKGENQAFHVTCARVYLEHATARGKMYTEGSLFSNGLSLKMKALRFFETSGITQQYRHKIATSKPQAQTLQVLSKT